jgi:hypothetical protein
MKLIYLCVFIAVSLMVSGNIYINNKNSYE